MTQVEDLNRAGSALAELHRRWAPLYARASSLAVEISDIEWQAGQPHLRLPIGTFRTDSEIDAWARFEKRRRPDQRDDIEGQSVAMKAQLAERVREVEALSEWLGRTARQAELDRTNRALKA